MAETSDPLFLTREMVDALHEREIAAYGGLRGLLNDHLLESAIAQPKHTYYLGGGDLFEVAAAYAFHIICDHPYSDGNKRTGAASALTFLEMNGVDTIGLPLALFYEHLIQMADHRMYRSALATFLRGALKPR